MAFADASAPAGAVNGLAQALLKLTVPGVPDFYQGTEFWDYSLVDPDNRRPVDFAARATALEAGEPRRCCERWRDGRVKQAAIARVLELRRRQPALFARGDYTPLAVEGPCAERVIAFARRSDDTAIIVVVPRLVFRLMTGDGLAIPRAAWGGTMVVLPAWLEGRVWRDVIGGAEHMGAAVSVGDILERVPAAVFDELSRAAPPRGGRPAQS